MNERQTYTQCDPKKLNELLLGSLSLEETAVVESHLSECASCAEQIQLAAVSGSSWNEAQSMLALDEFDGLPSLSSAKSLFPAEVGDREYTPTADLLAREIRGWLDPTDDPQMLGRFAGYEIMGIVGHGGMGIVLKGFEASLNRYVAIKVLAPRLAANGAARQRFAREAQAAAAVLHDNVVAIHRVDEFHGLPFLVMPYIADVSLQKRINDEGPLPIAAILRIGSQIAAGLAAAHHQGLVHRDIKPANIMLEKGVERVTITDFGLARTVDDASLTKTGIIAGTPQYMSPEQARGESVDQRSDLFSLGSVLYTMCTGRAPFRAETSYGVLRRITDEGPNPIQEINPDIPEWLCEIIAKLMSKQPDDRFESAREVAELLEECLAHVQQPTVVPLPHSRVFSKKNQPHRASGRFSWEPWASARRLIQRRSIGGITMIAVFGLALLGIFLWQSADPPDIAGRWTDEAWGEVVLEEKQPGKYDGTYTDTLGEENGTIQLKWSRLEGCFKGTWREGKDRYGKISVRLVGDEIRGAWTTNKKSGINPGTPELADLLWVRPEIESPKKTQVRVEEADKTELEGEWQWEEGGASDDTFLLRLSASGKAVGIEDGDEGDPCVGQWTVIDEKVKLTLNGKTSTGFLDEDGHLVIRDDEHGSQISLKRTVEDKAELANTRMRVLGANGRPVADNAVIRGTKGYSGPNLPELSETPWHRGVISLERLAAGTHWLLVRGSPPTVLRIDLPAAKEMIERRLPERPNLIGKDLDLKLTVEARDGAEFIAIEIQNRADRTVRLTEADLQFTTAIRGPEAEARVLSPLWRKVAAGEALPEIAIEPDRTATLRLNWADWVRHGFWFSRDCESFAEPSFPDLEAGKTWVRVTPGRARPVYVTHPDRIIPGGNDKLDRPGSTSPATQPYKTKPIGAKAANPPGERSEQATPTDDESNDRQSLAHAAKRFNASTAEMRGELFDPPIGNLTVERLREGFRQSAELYRDRGKPQIADALLEIAEIRRLPDEAPGGLIGFGGHNQDDDGKTIFWHVAPALVLPYDSTPSGRLLVVLRPLELIYRKDGPVSKDYGDLFDQETARLNGASERPAVERDVPKEKVPGTADSSANREKHTPQSVQYRGTCVRTEDSMPIEGAVVRFWLYGLSTREMTLWRITTTDAEGRFAIEGDIKSTDDIDLRRSRIAITAPKRASRVFFWQDSTREAMLEMAPVASITGRVTDSKSQPIAGATVRVGSRRMPGVNDALTDADGRFEIADLQAAEKLAFGMSNVLVVEHPEYDTQTTTFESVPSSVEIVLK